MVRHDRIEVSLPLPFFRSLIRTRLIGLPINYKELMRKCSAPNAVAKLFHKEVVHSAHNAVGVSVDRR